LGGGEKRGFVEKNDERDKKKEGKRKKKKKKKKKKRHVGQISASTRIFNHSERTGPDEDRVPHAGGRKKQAFTEMSKQEECPSPEARITSRLGEDRGTKSARADATI